MRSTTARSRRATRWPWLLGLAAGITLVGTLSADPGGSAVSRVLGSTVFGSTVAGASLDGPLLGALEEKAQADASSPIIVLDEIVDMVCFPPPAMIPPPCPVPIGTDPDLVAPNPAGQMRILVTDDDQTLLSIRLAGLSEAQVVTAWFVHYPPNQPPPHPIFAPIGPGLPPVAFIDTPVAHTAARFSEGLSREPNQLPVRGSGKARLISWLDYNPLKSQQVPLVNGMVLTQQAIAPPGSGAEQPDCCADFPAGPQPEPVGGSYLRQFDSETGYQLKDSSGRPVLLRSPTRPVAIAVVVHQDSLTSGIIPGVPTPPFLVDPPATAGSFYLLGLFPLVPLGMD